MNRKQKGLQFALNAITFSDLATEEREGGGGNSPPPTKKMVKWNYPWPEPVPEDTPKMEDPTMLTEVPITKVLEPEDIIGGNIPQEKLIEPEDM